MKGGANDSVPRANWRLYKTSYKTRITIWNNIVGNLWVCVISWIYNLLSMSIMSVMRILFYRKRFMPFYQIWRGKSWYICVSKVYWKMRMMNLTKHVVMTWLSNKHFAPGHPLVELPHSLLRSVDCAKMEIRCFAPRSLLKCKSNSLINSSICHFWKATLVELLRGSLLGHPPQHLLSLGGSASRSHSPPYTPSIVAAANWSLFCSKRYLRLLWSKNTSNLLPYQQYLQFFHGKGHHCKL